MSVTTASGGVQDSNKLLNQLLDCVQQCQKRYGGKTELATEFDGCVANLCLTLEAIFLHGLRSKPQQEQQSHNKATNPISTLKQVSDIVTNTLNFNNDNPSFWPFVKKQLTRHEQDRYSVLKQIWTDTGRGKAWIRSTLNERSLERYLHTLLSNPNLLKSHYEEWAFLRDDEKNSMLPNMAAGLVSILFAISIDKPELNSGNNVLLLLQSKAAATTRSEPIIDAPIKAQNTQKHKFRKRKVAKQIISFDEDADDEMIESGSSVPSISSNSSSTSSCTTQEIGAVENKRKLSVENSGNRDKFAMRFEGPLTPVAQAFIGELTPMSVEEQRSEDGDEEVEIPSDISAVLSAVETQNKEHLDKLQQRMDLLQLENDNLNEQLRKYMGAVQMLKRDDVGLQKALNGLQLDEVPDYKTEAKLYEDKLVQVAEMHAELMDFNAKLQQTLAIKDASMEKMRVELEELRGPPVFNELGFVAEALVNVWIPSAFLTGGSGSQAHHVYQVYLRAGADEWNIYRRYAQFHALHSDLKKLDPVAIATFDFPPKKSLGNKESSLVEDRRRRLQIYLRRVLHHWPELSQCNSRFLLEQHLTFFKDKPASATTGADQARNTAASADNRRSIFPSGRNDNHYTGL